MSRWLATKAPDRFNELLLPDAVKSTIERTAVQENPPHLLLSGPPGVGKTAAWRLIARQVLGPAWEARTHVLQARDLARTSGAMSKFEEFLRPEGSSSSDTLAGRTSLDAYDAAFSGTAATTPAPAGKESTPATHQGRAPVSRLIVIEDADHLGTIRQSYLRRMMESASGSARFIFTTHTPSQRFEVEPNTSAFPHQAGKKSKRASLRSLKKSRLMLQGAFLVTSHTLQTATSARRSLSQSCLVTGQCLATEKTYNT